MRWMLTDDVPELVTALENAGHEVVTGLYVDRWQKVLTHPRDYPLLALAERVKPDVAVLVNPLRRTRGAGGASIQFGFFRDHSKQMRRRGIQLVGLSVGDPAVLRAYRAHPRLCICRLQDFAVYVTPDAGAKAEVAKVARTVLWRPDAPPVAAIVSALAHARARKPYRASRDANRW